MTRILLGIVVVLHALAHISVGVWAMASGPQWIIAILWVASVVTLLASGFGLLGWPPTKQRWWPMLLVGVMLSEVFLFAFAQAVAAFGALAGVIVIGAGWAETRPPRPAPPPPLSEFGKTPQRGFGRGLVTGAIGALLVYITGVGLFRPAYLTWGSTRIERAMVLPGDVPGARYRVDHAITIHAPAREVARWLSPNGENRGSLYGYAGGGDGRTSTSAGRQVDLQPEAAAPIGWRVSHVERVAGFVPDNRGAFVLLAVDSSTTRLLVRTRGAGTPDLQGLLLGPVSVLVLEPVHFIVQQGILRDIKSRAERGVTPAMSSRTRPS